MCTREERKNKDVACLDFTLKAKLASLLPPSSSFLQKTAGAKHRSCLRQKEMLCVTEGPDLRGKNPDPKRSLWNFFFFWFCSHGVTADLLVFPLPQRVTQKEAWVRGA